MHRDEHPTCFWWVSDSGKAALGHQSSIEQSGLRLKLRTLSSWPLSSAASLREGYFQTTALLWAEVAAHLSVRWHEWEAAALPASWKRVERPLQLQNESLPRVEECVGFVWEQSVWLTDSAEHKSGAVSLPIKSTSLSDTRSWSLKTNTSRYRCWKWFHMLLNHNVVVAVVHSRLQSSETKIRFWSLIMSLLSERLTCTCCHLISDLSFTVVLTVVHGWFKQ